MSEGEDMQLEGIDSEEAQLNVVEAAPAVMPTVELSFGTSAGGAWDDRELVNAYDTAIEEFHLHHPGPGTWLDKATAALAKGQPLPGAQPKNPNWYAASFTGTAAELLSQQHMPEPEPAWEPPAKKPRREPKRSKQEQVDVDSSNPYTNGASSSRYASDRADPHHLQRAASPIYAPMSPPIGARVPAWADGVHGNGNGNSNGGHDDDEMDYPNAEALLDEQTEQPTALHGQVPATGPGPTYGVQPTGHVSADDAFAYAMSAQYWAGYWMGVAQTKSRGTPTRVAQISEGGGGGAVGPTNVFRTRRQFWREQNGTAALRR